MIEVTTGTTNYISFYSRYNMINKWEIIDHNSKIVYSGNTAIVGIDGKMQLTGLTFNFTKNELYTFIGYYLYAGTYYLATQQMIRTWVGDNRVDNYVQETKPKNQFKIYGK